MPLTPPDLDSNSKEIKYLSNGMKSNNDTENMNVSANQSTALDDIKSTMETVPKSSSSRFSVQSVSENGDIKSEPPKLVDQNEPKQNFTFEQSIKATGSNNRLPMITEDVSYA